MQKLRWGKINAGNKNTLGFRKVPDRFRQNQDSWHISASRDPFGAAFQFRAQPSDAVCAMESSRASCSGVTSGKWPSSIFWNGGAETKSWVFIDQFWKRHWRLLEICKQLKCGRLGGRSLEHSRVHFGRCWFWKQMKNGPGRHGALSPIWVICWTWYGESYRLIILIENGFHLIRL
jgi:hypothetical protein